MHNKVIFNSKSLNRPSFQPVFQAPEFKRKCSPLKKSSYNTKAQLLWVEKLSKRKPKVLSNLQNRKKYFLWNFFSRLLSTDYRQCDSIRFFLESIKFEYFQTSNLAADPEKILFGGSENRPQFSTIVFCSLDVFKNYTLADTDFKPWLSNL